MRSRTAIAFLGLAAVVAGCNAILDLSRFSEAPAHDAGTSSVAADAAPPGPFDCLSAANEPLDPANVTMHVLVDDATQTIEAAGAIDGGSDLDEVVYSPTPGVTVTPCLSLDPFCAKPVSPSQVTDDGGIATFSIPGNFVGFLQVESPGIVPFTLFPGQWLTGLTEATYGTSALTPASEALLNLALGNAVDLDAGSGLGELFIVVFDCFDHHLAGVKFSFTESASNTLPFYLTAGVPSTMAGVTDSEGVGGALNMKEGPLQATATFAATNQVLGSVNLYVRAGALTYGWIRMRVH